jgi:hypothetical protein
MQDVDARSILDSNATAPVPPKSVPPGSRAARIQRPVYGEGCFPLLDSDRHSFFFRADALHSRRPHPLEPKPDPNEPSGHASQEWNMGEDAEHGREARSALAPGEGRPDNSLLHQDLEPLRDARRELATALHTTEVTRREAALANRPRYHIRGGDCILDREIDPDAPHR